MKVLFCLPIGLIMLLALSGCSTKKPVRINPQIEFVVPAAALTQDVILFNCSDSQNPASCKTTRVTWKKGAEHLEIVK